MPYFIWFYCIWRRVPSAPPYLSKPHKRLKAALILRQFVRTQSLWGGMYLKAGGGRKPTADTSDPAATHQKLILKKEEAMYCRR